MSQYSGDYRSLERGSDFSSTVFYTVRHSVSNSNEEKVKKSLKYKGVEVCRYI